MGEDPSARARRGLLITLEGGEGAGKSLQAEALARRFEAAGQAVLRTREPGGTRLGERLRDVLLGLSDDTTVPIDPLAEALLFAAARAELVRTVIAPALAEGKVVICDRFADSTRVYQGFGRGVDLKIIDELNAIATGGLQPHLTVLLNLEPREGLARATGGADRFGREALEFHERVRQGYRTLAAAETERWLVVSATLAPQEITEVIFARAQELLAERRRP